MRGDRLIRATEDYRAAGAAEAPPIEALLTLLDHYDEVQARRPPDADVQRQRSVDDWTRSFISFREDRLRASLEEVVSQLAKRGHHAWLEDGEPEAAPDRVEGDHEVRPVARPLVLCLVPAHEPPSARAHPPALLFRPDPESCWVSVDVESGPTERRTSRRLEHGLTLEELDEANIVAIATRFVAPVLLGSTPTAGELARWSPPRAERPESAGERQWADSGLPEATPDVGRSD